MTDRFSLVKNVQGNIPWLMAWSSAFYDVWLYEFYMHLCVAKAGFETIFELQITKNLIKLRLNDYEHF